MKVRAYSHVKYQAGITSPLLILTPRPAKRRRDARGRIILKKLEERQLEEMYHELMPSSGPPWGDPAYGCSDLARRMSLSTSRVSYLWALSDDLFRDADKRLPWSVLRGGNEINRAGEPSVYIVHAYPSEEFRFGDPRRKLVFYAAGRMRATRTVTSMCNQERLLHMLWEGETDAVIKESLRKTIVPLQYSIQLAMEVEDRLYGHVPPPSPPPRMPKRPKGPRPKGPTPSPRSPRRPPPVPPAMLALPKPEPKPVRHPRVTIEDWGDLPEPTSDIRN